MDEFEDSDSKKGNHCCSEFKATSLTTHKMMGWSSDFLG